MTRKRREMEEFSVSFLDVICCGFGAIILLLMITKTVQPLVVEQSSVNMEGLVQNLQEQLFRLRGETVVLNRDLDAKHEQLSEEEKRIAILKSELDSVQADIRRMASASTSDSRRGELYLALQTLTEEMERLLGRQHQPKNNVIGGIPVDSEYLIFIIDTSGSMQNYAWERMINEMMATLEIYPHVKGIQVLSDMGDYLFSNYRGEWIPDTPGRREVIVKRLRNWAPFSNSSPVEGIERAIRTFYDPKKKISLYVMGDEFTGNSIQSVVRSVDRLNRERKPGERQVRIHAVGFPVVFAQPEHLHTTGIRFAALMRELTYQNGGTFVGLNDFRR